MPVWLGMGFGTTFLQMDAMNEARYHNLELSRADTPRPGLLDELVTPQMVLSAVLALRALGRNTHSEDLIDYVASRYRLLETEELMIDMELAIECCVRLGLLAEKDGCFYTERESAALSREELEDYYQELRILRLSAQQPENEKEIPSDHEICRDQDEDSVSRRLGRKRRLYETSDLDAGDPMKRTCWPMRLCKWSPVSLQMIVNTLRGLKDLPIPASLNDLAINLSSRHHVCPNVKRLLAEIELKTAIAKQLGIVDQDQRGRYSIDDHYLAGPLPESMLKHFWRQYYRSKYLARCMPATSEAEAELNTDDVFLEKKKKFDYQDFCSETSLSDEEEDKTEKKRDDEDDEDDEEEEESKDKDEENEDENENESDEDESEDDSEKDPIEETTTSGHSEETSEES